MEPAPGRRWRASVRVRVLGAVLALTALGVLAAGGSAHLANRERAERSVDEVLARSVEEFNRLARDGEDPETGEPFDSASRLVYIALQRMVPASNEGMLGYVDGARRWDAPVTVAVRLEQDPELLDHLDAFSPPSAGPLSPRRVTTAMTTWEYAAVPVSGAQLDSADSAMFVVAVDVDAVLAPVDETFRTFFLIALGALALVGAVGWLVAGRLLAPLASLRRTAQQISDSDLSGRIEVSGTGDDVAELAHTVNAMLDRLEAAFSSQRELLDDVSHELRTPLTVLRGHLELLDETDAADVASTRAIALDEIDRMGRLVADLTTLAKAQRPDFVLPASTDLGLLTDEVFDKARTLGPRAWSLVERADTEGAVDGQRLTQAWLQLAANAVKFSAEGSAIRLGSRVHDGVFSAWVSDEGQGIAPQDLERIFERFERAEGARVEGSGLGLAIVSAIATAHGGRVEVTSEPDVGSTFAIEIPLSVRDAGGHDEEHGGVE